MAAKVAAATLNVLAPGGTRDARPTVTSVTPCDTNSGESVPGHQAFERTEALAPGPERALAAS